MRTLLTAKQRILNRRKTQAKYRLNNPEKSKASTERYRKRHPKKFKAMRKANRDKHAAENRAYSNGYHAGKKYTISKLNPELGVNPGYIRNALAEIQSDAKVLMHNVKALLTSTRVKKGHKYRS